MKRSLTRIESRNLRNDLRRVGLDGYAANIGERSQALGNIARDRDGDMMAAYERLDRAHEQALGIMKKFFPAYWPAPTEGKAQEVKA